MAAFFVTSTGTEIGKTFVTAGLVRHFRATGQRIGAIKPVMTGYDPAEAATSDAGVLLQALDRKPWPATVENMAPWHFRAPLSPDMAAAREGRRIDTDVLFAHCRVAMETTRGMLLIEGIGGIMVPLTEKHTVLDWMAALNIPIVLVTGTYVGTLSHTLTCLDVLARRGLTVEALVVNNTPGSPVTFQNTVSTLSNFERNISMAGLQWRADALPGDRAFQSIAEMLET